MSGNGPSSRIAWSPANLTTRPSRRSEMCTGASAHGRFSRGAGNTRNQTLSSSRRGEKTMCALSSTSTRASMR